MGNVYNVEQISTPASVAAGKDASKTGLDQWKAEVRKQLMQKLRSYSPEHIDKIIKTTFGDSYI